MAFDRCGPVMWVAGTGVSSPTFFLAASGLLSLAEQVVSFRESLQGYGATAAASWKGGRGQLLSLPTPQQGKDLEAEVIRGLTDPSGKWIHTRFRYDATGSELYARICKECPTYYLTRSEAAILQRDASRIMAHLGDNRSLAELGSGNSEKTRHLLAAWKEGHYVPVDISGSMLVATTPPLLEDFPNLWISALHATYDRAFAALGNLAPGLPISILFLGSNIGNFYPETRSEFFAEIAAVLQPGGFFAFGADLHKETATLEAAYNDSDETNGLWSQFNLNVLRRLNRELGADFDLTQFRYFAIYNEGERRMEMYLESHKKQEVPIGEETITLEKGESIKMSFSYKFTSDELEQELRRHGLEPIDFIRDPQSRFGFLVTQRTPL